MEKRVCRSKFLIRRLILAVFIVVCGALIVHSVVSLPPSAVERQVAEKARASGWAKAAGVERTWLLDNLVFTYTTSMRRDGTMCDVDYRFSDDESGLYTKGKQDEN